MSSQRKVNPKAFWENKILGWETGRYEQKSNHGGMMEKIADRASSSLRYRLAVTYDLLAPHIRGKTVVELGCGSAFLAEKMIKEAGAKSYVGYDIAESAIACAKARLGPQNFGDQIQVHVGDTSALPDTERDVVFSLGLLDWLNDEELLKLLQFSANADFFHAISEKRLSASQILHKAYCYVAYGYKTGSYVPRYFSCREIAALEQQASGQQRPIYAYRNPQLSFGALLSSLPIGEQL